MLQLLMSRVGIPMDSTYNPYSPEQAEACPSCNDQLSGAPLAEGLKITKNGRSYLTDWFIMTGSDRSKHLNTISMTKRKELVEAHICTRCGYIIG